MIRALHLLKTSQGAMWAVRQIRHLVMKGVEIHVALPSGGARIKELEHAGAIPHIVNMDFPIGKPSACFEAFRNINRLVRETRPDILHSHFVGTTLTMRLGMGRNSPIPRIFQVPGPLHLENVFYRKMEIMTAGPNDYWIGACRKSRDLYLRSGISPDRVYLNGYGTERGSYQNVSPAPLRKQLGLSKKTKIIGMVALIYRPKLHLGQTRGIKGHEDFIDAISLCLRNGRDLVGVCVGGARRGAEKYEASLRRRARKKCGDKLIFLGWRPVEDVPGLILNFDVAIVPSLTENMGGAYEPMLMGIPVVATSVGGLLDIILQAETGWLVPPKNPQAIAKAVGRVLDEPEAAKRISVEGQRKMQSISDPERIASRMINIYKDILSRHEHGKNMT